MKTSIATIITVLSLVLPGCGAGIQVEPDTVRPVLTLADVGLAALDVPEASDEIAGMRDLLPAGQAALDAWELASDDAPPAAWITWASQAAAALGRLVLSLERYGVHLPCWASMLATTLIGLGAAESCSLE